MWQQLRSRQFSKKTIPWMFAFAAILAYGLLTPWMGFYWDDWVFVWLLKHHGSVELARSFLPYDPLVSPFFLITSSLFGTHPFAWQIFGLIVRIAVSDAALWTFNQIWPQNSRQVLWAALLFLLYPGYAQQWVAFTHANQEWISFGAIILSLGFTARSLREPASKKWIVYALITQFIGLATTEYFLGMEFLRPVIIWIVTARPEQPFLKQCINALKSWAAYIAIWLLAGIGQFLYHESSSYGGHSFGVDLSERGIPRLVLSFLKDIVPTLRTTVFDAWIQTVNLITTSLSSLTDWLALGLIVLSFIIFAFYFHRLQNDQEVTDRDKWASQAILLGLVGIVAGRIPSWLAGLPVVLRFDWDRLLISMLFGISLLTAGLIDYLIKDGFRKQLLISFILALAIGMQFQQANTFRRAWQSQKNFFWQLAWRAPALKPGTMLLTDELPLQYVADLQLSAPLNLLYDPNASSFSRIVVYVKNRLGGPLLPKLAANLPVESRYRTVEFKSNTSNIVMVYAPSDGCLQLLDPRYMSQDTFSSLPQSLTTNIQLSNVDQIENQPQAKPSQYFGSEPAHSWCYYFEKADLARQFDGWEQVTKIYRSATSAGYTALLPSENLVFVEAFARLGDVQQAGKLSDSTIAQDHKLCKALVDVWERATQASPEISAEAQKKTESLNDLPECK
jgi:hypothetical protein